MLFAATIYALHLIALPAGWAMPDRDAAVGTRPAYAAMGANGSVAVILARWSGRYDDPRACRSAWQQFTQRCRDSRIQFPARRILVLRSDGSTTILRPPLSISLNGFPSADDCRRDEMQCGYFERVALARDGTPFVTYAVYFSGAYSGERRVALVWNDSWHVVKTYGALHGLAKPEDPRNVSVTAAYTPDDYAFVGDYSDSFPQEDLDLAANDPRWMAEIAGAAFHSGSVGLGLGSATAIRGSFIAGFDDGAKLVVAKSAPASLALLWECGHSNTGPNRCRRHVLGPGTAYGVDFRGDAIGDGEPKYGGDLRCQAAPVLWRNGNAVELSDASGSAYAIAPYGTIVGMLCGAGAFVADARDARPRARALDRFVVNLGRRHVRVAFGIADDGRILALVVNRADPPDAQGRLAILAPVGTR
jgi:hypothetical protein